MKKKFIEKTEKMVDVFFSDAWQSKVFAMIFSIFVVICFIAGFWNYIHFLFSAMCGLMVYVLFNELKSKQHESEKETAGKPGKKYCKHNG